MQIVIIGGGAAGIAAATHLRRQNTTADIILIDKAQDIATAKCGLPFLFDSQPIAASQLIGATGQQLEQIFHIKLYKATEVLTIDTARHTLYLSTRQTLSYDKLILATGVFRSRPEIKGLLQDNVFSLTDLGSAQKIADYIQTNHPTEILIIGSDNQALCLADVFARQNLHIDLLDKNTSLFPFLDDEFADFVQKQTSCPNLHFYPHTPILSLKSSKAHLADNITLPYDMLLLTTRQRPDVRLPIMSDIAISPNGAVIVSGQMATSVPDIYACGHNIELRNPLTDTPYCPSNLSTVIQTAKCAADNILNLGQPPSVIIPNQLVCLQNKLIGRVGCTETELKQTRLAYHKLYLRCDDAESFIPNRQPMFFKLLFAPSGQILGLQAFGSPAVRTPLACCQILMEHRGFIQDLAFTSLPYLPDQGKAKDALNILGTLALEINQHHLQTADINELQSGDCVLNLTLQHPLVLPPEVQTCRCKLEDLPKRLNTLSAYSRLFLASSGGYASYLAYCLLRNQTAIPPVFWLNSVDLW